VFTGAMLNILYQRASSGLMGIVLAGYGTGAVMVPCGDERDYVLLTSLKDKMECRKSKHFCQC
jgi:hypothetical protein